MKVSDTFNGAYILFNAPQHINEYQYIWGSDLREFGYKGIWIRGSTVYLQKRMFVVIAIFLNGMQLHVLPRTIYFVV